MPYFIFIFTRNIVIPQGKYMWQEFLSPSRHSLFLWSYFFQNLRQKVAPSPQIEKRCWYFGDIGDCYQNVWHNSYFILIYIQMNIKACIFCILFSKSVSSYIVFKVIFFFIFVFISFRNSSIFLQLFLNSHWKVFHKRTYKIICQNSWKGPGKEFV